jgi:biotin operon repressor
MTSRQQEIKRRLDDGKSVREIAAELGITRNGVYQHIHSMRRHGDLPLAYTPTGRSVRSPALPPPSPHDEQSESELAIRLLLTELKRTHDDLARICDRLGAVVPDGHEPRSDVVHRRARGPGLGLGDVGDR